MTTTKKAELEALLQTLPENVAERVRELTSNPLELLVDEAKLKSASGSMHIGRLETGLWQARGLCAEKLKIDLGAQGVALENSRVELQLDVELGFQFPSLSGTGPRVYKAGPAPGRVSTPTLKRIDLSALTRRMGLSFLLSSVCTDVATADVAPLVDLDAGTGGLRDGEARGIAVPTTLGELFEASGVAVEQLGLPETAAEVVSIGSLGADDRLTARDVVLRGASIPAAEVGTVQGGELDLDFEVRLPKMKIKTFPDMPSIIERLVTRFWVEITPTLVMHIGNLLLDGLVISTDVGKLKISELSLPFVLEKVDARGVRIGRLELSGIGLKEKNGDEE